MPRKRTSVIWSISRERFIEVVKTSKSLMDIMRHFGLVQTGTSYILLKKRMQEDNIDYSHISTGLGSNRGRKFPSKAIPLGQVMVENSSYCRSSLKGRLLKSGMLKNECSLCGQKEEWNGKRLVMVLDHINGVNNDNRMENLRMVCPNCDSQLDTTTGKNRRKKRNCLICGKIVGRGCQFCDECRPHYRKVMLDDRPTKEELGKMVKEMPMVQIGKRYGVSDNCIRKWCRDYGIQLERKNHPVVKRFCSCGRELSDYNESGKCSECFRSSTRKVVPSKEALQKDISEMSMRAAARKYSVSRGTIRDWMK